MAKAWGNCGRSQPNTGAMQSKAAVGHSNRYRLEHIIHPARSLPRLVMVTHHAADFVRGKTDLQRQGPVIECEDPQQRQHGSPKAEHVGVPHISQGCSWRPKQVHAQHRIDEHDQQEQAGNVDDGWQRREQRVEQSAQSPAEFRQIVDCAERNFASTLR